MAFFPLLMYVIYHLSNYLLASIVVPYTKVTAFLKDFLLGLSKKGKKTFEVNYMWALSRLGISAVIEFPI